MRAFEDAKGREWSIEISPIELLRIRQRADFKLTEILVNGEDGQSCAGLLRLSTDIELLVDCIWACVEDQAESIGVSMDDFLRGLHGDALAAAMEALVDGTVDFFPDEEARSGARSILELLRRMHAEMRTKATEGVAKILQSASSDSHGNLQEYVESILRAGGGTSES